MAAMNFPDLSDSGKLEFDFFVRALRQIFHGESWEDVQPYAERAWNACDLSEWMAWQDVAGAVRDAWPGDGGGAAPE